MKKPTLTCPHCKAVIDYNDKDVFVTPKKERAIICTECSRMIKLTHLEK
jgi:hypothetical protein